MLINIPWSLGFSGLMVEPLYTFSTIIQVVVGVCLSNTPDVYDVLRSRSKWLSFLILQVESQHWSVGASTKKKINAGSKQQSKGKVEIYWYGPLTPSLEDSEVTICIAYVRAREQRNIKISYEENVLSASIEIRQLAVIYNIRNSLGQFYADHTLSNTFYAFRRCLAVPSILIAGVEKLH